MSDTEQPASAESEKATIPAEAPAVAAASSGAGSNRRKWFARALLVIVALWLIVKVITIASGDVLQALDFTNPSLLGILGFSSLVAYFFVRPRK
jgi:hypothetical protein